MPTDPFLEDVAVCRLAERHGLLVSRFESIEITDPAALEAAGLVKLGPDYSKIRRAMANGASVPGVKLGAVEYKLRKMSENLGGETR